MKSAISIYAIILMALLAGCAKENIPPVDDHNTNDQIVGTWKITSFIDDGVDYANLFDEFTFVCDASGHMTIEGNSDNYNCTWNWDDNQDSTCYFHINGCGMNSCLWWLNYGWEMMSYDDMFCNFMNDDPHEGNCSGMMNHHDRMMKWTRIN